MKLVWGHKESKFKVGDLVVTKERDDVKKSYCIVKKIGEMFEETVYFGHWRSTVLEAIHASIILDNTGTTYLENTEISLSNSHITKELIDNIRKIKR
jgi:hypothetical protein